MAPSAGKDDPYRLTNLVRPLTIFVNTYRRRLFKSGGLIINLFYYQIVKYNMRPSTNFGMLFAHCQDQSIHGGTRRQTRPYPTSNKRLTKTEGG